MKRIVQIYGLDGQKSRRIIMSNHLTFAKKTLVLSSLVEGNSIRSIERISGVHRDTIMRLLVHAGEKAALNSRRLYART